MKKCPYCAESMESDTALCRKCGSLHDAAPRNSTRPQIQQAPATRAQTPQVAAAAGADYGALLLAAPFAATLLIWFWVSGMNLFQSPASSLGLIAVATVLGTAAIAALEASKLGMQSDREKGTYDSTTWFFLVSLLWVIGYPAYLLKRKDYGLRNLLPMGILVGSVFVGSLAMMNFAIESKKDEIRANLEESQQQLQQFQERAQQMQQEAELAQQKAMKEFEELQKTAENDLQEQMRRIRRSR